MVEIDGPAHDHDARWAYDERRQAWLEAEGYAVMRINVEEITRDFADVLDGIYGALVERERQGYKRRPHRPAAPATSPQAGKSSD